VSSATIASVLGREIFDSRGRPTVEAEVWLAGGTMGRASSPSGASRGAAEAMELRDGDLERYEGRGVLQAVAHVNGEIAAALLGRDGTDQQGADDLIRALDGAGQFARLGGNAALAVSVALVRAGAKAEGQSLHRRIADLTGCAQPTLPLPMVNILSGGLHAAGGMDVQDFLAVPVSATSFSEALAWVSRVRAAAADLCSEAGLSTLLADEGGLSPGFALGEEALELMVRAIERASLRPGEDVAIALDIAASGLIDSTGRYHLSRAGHVMISAEMIGLLDEWTRTWPVVSIEDGLGEEDWLGWPELTKRLASIQVVGDDLFATQPDRIARGVREGAANAALIKINQNGTFSGTCAAMRAARAGGYACVVSARSGETEDSFIADLAVGCGAGQIKVGSVRNSERMAKYNQLLRLEEEGLPFAGRAALAGS
jgi:enolase